MSKFFTTHNVWVLELIASLEIPRSYNRERSSFYLHSILSLHTWDLSFLYFDLFSQLRELTLLRLYTADTFCQLNSRASLHTISTDLPYLSSGPYYNYTARAHSPRRLDSPRCISLIRPSLMYATRSSHDSQLLHWKRFPDGRSFFSYNDYSRLSSNTCSKSCCGPLRSE